MSIILKLPALSPTMEEGIIQEWSVKEGDTVQAGDIIALIETDKAVMEMESPEDGIIGKLLLPASSEEIKVGTSIAVLLMNGETMDDVKIPSTPTPSLESSIFEPKAPDTSVVTLPVNVRATNSTPPLSTKNKRIFISPLARRIAQEKGLNIELIEGTGPHGRIVKRNVKNAKIQPKISVQFESKFESKVVPFSTYQKALIRNMDESNAHIPHFFVTREVLVDSLLELRAEINQDKEKIKKVSVNDMLIKAVAVAFTKMPEVNIGYSKAGVVFFPSVNVSMAVAVKDRLYTPVIQRVDQKPLLQVSEEAKEIINKTREGKLQPEDYTGGTFTISNMGMLNVDSFSAIINPPQAMILAVSASKKKPVVKDDQLTIATVMSLTLSVDHRVVNGAAGAKFIDIYVNILENPINILL